MFNIGDKVKFKESIIGDIFTIEDKDVDTDWNKNIYKLINDKWWCFESALELVAKVEINEKQKESYPTLNTRRQNNNKK